MGLVERVRRSRREVCAVVAAGNGRDPESVAEGRSVRASVVIVGVLVVVLVCDSFLAYVGQTPVANVWQPRAQGCETDRARWDTLEGRAKRKGMISGRKLH